MVGVYSRNNLPVNQCRLQTAIFFLTTLIRVKCIWLVTANFHPINSVTYIWVVKRLKYGSPVFIPETLFCEGGSSGTVF